MDLSVTFITATHWMQNWTYKFYVAYFEHCADWKYNIKPKYIMNEIKANSYMRLVRLSLHETWKVLKILVSCQLSHYTTSSSMRFTFYIWDYLARADICRYLQFDTDSKRFSFKLREAIRQRCLWFAIDFQRESDCNKAGFYLLVLNPTCDAMVQYANHYTTTAPDKKLNNKK